MDSIYFAMAQRNAETEFQPERTVDPRLQTHWSYYDAPRLALCGERIEPEQFSRNPSCHICQQELQKMQTEAIR